MTEAEKVDEEVIRRKNKEMEALMQIEFLNLMTVDASSSQSF